MALNNADNNSRLFVTLISEHIYGNGSKLNLFDNVLRLIISWGFYKKDKHKIKSEY